MRKLLLLLAVVLAPALTSAQTTISALNDAVTGEGGNLGAAGFQLTGSCSAGVVTFEGTLDNSTWTAINVFPVASAVATTTASAPGIWTANIGGLRKVRMRVSDACDSDNFVGTIRITSSAAGASASSGSAGTQYAEDSVHVSGDQMTMAGFVQQTANTALAANGDRAVAQVGSTGGLKTEIIAGAGFDCTGHAIYSASTNGNTELVAISGSTVVYVCGYIITTSQTTAVNVRLVRGTGTACATNETSMTPTYVLQAPASVGPTGITSMIGGHTGHKTAAGDALCIETNQAVAVQAEVWYAQF